MYKPNTLFSKVMTLTALSILVVSLIISSISVFFAEKILLKQVIDNAYLNLTRAHSGLLDYNAEVLSAMGKIQDSSAFRNYIMTDSPSYLEELNLAINLGQFLDQQQAHLERSYAHLIVSGVGPYSERRFISAGLKWNLELPDFLKTYMFLDGSIPNKILYHGYQDHFKNMMPSQNYILATKPLIHTFNRTLYGYMVVMIEEQTLYAQYSPYLGLGQDISIISRNGTILSSSSKNTIATQNSDLLDLAVFTASLPQGVYTDHHAKMTTIAMYLPFYDAYLIKQIDQKVAFSSLYQVSRYIFVLLAIVLIIAFFVIKNFCKRLTKPLTSLVSTMCTPSCHDLQIQRIDRRSTEELVQLTKAYNSMVNEINMHVAELLSEQERRRSAELSALQMQINPHFLYNTLSSIKYLAKSGSTTQVDLTIDCLIAMLQNTIGTTSELITLKEELENLEFYIYISQTRYGDHIKVDYSLPPDCEAVLIPKLLIQPFIENAFFHAFVGRASGTINLFISHFENHLIIEIVDNGMGMDTTKEPAPSRRTCSGIGIKNVEERIHLLYGKSYGITIQSEVGYGTSITLRLPYNL